VGGARAWGAGQTPPGHPSNRRFARWCPLPWRTARRLLSTGHTPGKGKILHKMATLGSHSLGSLHESSGHSVSPLGSRHFLLVMTVDSLAIEPLPTDGHLIIGRSKSADLKLGDAGVAARHLRLAVGQRITVEDLGSASGTRVAGVTLAPHQAVEVLPGEAISLGATVLMVREMTTTERPQRIWSHAAFQQRLSEECERGGRGGNGFTLVRVMLTSGAGDLPAPAGPLPLPPRAIEQTLGLLAANAPSPHVAGVYGPGEYELLLVGMTPAQAVQRVTALQNALGEAGLVTRSGIANFPSDGRAGATLLDRANARLFATTPGATCFSAADESLIAANAAHDCPVLLVGESGTGKETLARAIHGRSARASGPFCVVEAQGRSAAELELALFEEKSGELGAWFAAAGGTLFVADADWLPTAILLRLARPEHAEAAPRLIVTRTVDSPGALTSPALSLGSQLDRRRQLRRNPGELLGVDEIVVAPLRNRSAHLSPLIDCLMANAAHARGHGATAMTPEGRAWLERRPWPGNIRELKNIVDRSVAVASFETGSSQHREDEGHDFGAGIDPRVVPLDLRDAVAEVLMQTAELHAGSLGGERDRIMAALAACAFNQSRAAARLGISRRTLVARLGQFGIDRPLKQSS
jgi:DNA-binding NtrC family response regulator